MKLQRYLQFREMSGLIYNSNLSKQRKNSVCRRDNFYFNTT